MPPAAASGAPLRFPSVCAFEHGAACGAHTYVAAAGGAANNAALCASGTCGGGGYCCTPTAAALGCSACAPASGACSLRGPGEPCGVHYDCGSGQCSGGCCCSVPVAVASASVGGGVCGACQCFGSGGGGGVAVGGCTTYLAPPPTPLPTLPPTTAGSCVTCASFATAEAVRDVYILPAASPLNPLPGTDLALGKPGVCQELALAAAAAGVANIRAILPCLNATRAVYVDGGSWEVLGPAAGLQMSAQPSNCAPSPSAATPSALPAASYQASFAPSPSYAPSAAW